jgi:predicted GNAT family N-acyltransferase
VTVAAEPDYRIEPLGPSHDRSAFSSCVIELDVYFHNQASQDAKRRVATPFVLVDPAGSILGYYALSAYAIRLDALPSAIIKRLPRYPLIPSTLLGRLAVSSAARGRRLGKLLLMDALHRSWRNTAEVASLGVVVDALDDAARSFYLHHEFLPLPDHPNRLFLAMGTIEKVFRPR